jgi:TPP-dependent pyruvate/acetoin dehydrogenase alpha subunit
LKKQVSKLGFPLSKAFGNSSKVISFYNKNNLPMSEQKIRSNKEVLLKLYHCMLKIRMAEEKIAEIYPTDKIQSPVHLCIGQEAVSAGACLALQPSDHLYGTYRSHGIFIAKGGDLKSLFAELYGKETGCCRGKGGSMHLVAPDAGLMGCSAIVASTIPVATGDALASQMQGRKRVVVAFFGDGAVDEGVFFESINFAALKNLPILFVCENNHYAIHSKVADRHKQTEIYRMGEGLGISGRRFEGNDVQTVFSSMKQAVDEIRAGGQPLIMEYLTYRWHEHVGLALDHREVYRSPEKTAWGKASDPLKRARQVLENQFKVNSAIFDEMKEALAIEIQEAVDFAEHSPFPIPEQLYQDTFAERS